MTPAGPLVVVGDALLDRDVDGHGQPAVPGRARPGARRPDRDPAPGRRRAGRAARGAADGARWCWSRRSATTRPAPTVRALLEPHVTVVPLPLDGPLPDKARFRAGRPDPAARRRARPAGRARAGAWRPPRRSRRRARSWSPTTAAARPPTRRIRAALAGRAARVPLVWDPHPRGAGAGARHPAGHAQPRRGPGGRRPGPPAAGPPTGGPAAAAPAGAPLRRRGRGPAAQPVAGGRGGRDPGPHGDTARPGRPGPAGGPGPAACTAADTCGAGDQFAAAAAAALSHGALPSEAVVTATRTAARLPRRGRRGQPASRRRTGAAPERPGRSGTGRGCTGRRGRPRTPAALARAGPRGRRHGGGHRRLLRRAARRPRQPAAGGPLAG